MRIIDLHSLNTFPIRDYDSSAASSRALAMGSGDSHVHWVCVSPGGVIGPHPAGFAQLLIPLDGSGWAAGADGVRLPISPGQAAAIAAGETHSKGSDAGMQAVMIQVSALTLQDG